MDRNRKVFLKASIAYIIMTALVIMFVKVADEVRENETLSFDKNILLWINSFSNPTLDKVMIFITNYGGFIGAIIISVILLAYLLKRKRKYDAIFAALGIGGTLLINNILKIVFKRARPSLWDLLISENSYSFPSGHTMISLSIVLVLILIFRYNKYRNLLIVISIIYAILVAFSRLYLGVHYPTDILGGWLISSFWVLLSYRIVFNEVYE